MMGMGSFSIGHFLFLLVYVAIVVIPLWRIIKRAGYPGAWALLAIIPLANIIALWYFAFTPWPSKKRES